MTSYEDLPADLFGEEDPGPIPPRGDDGPRPASPAPRAAPPASAKEGEEGEEDDAFATVRRLFPGRVVALEPYEAASDDEPAEDAPVAETDASDGRAEEGVDA